MITFFCFRRPTYAVRRFEHTADLAKIIHGVVGNVNLVKAENGNDKKRLRTTDLQDHKLVNCSENPKTILSCDVTISN